MQEFRINKIIYYCIEEKKDNSVYGEPLIYCLDVIIGN